MVAESTLIFGPIFQVGCCNALLGVTLDKDPTGVFLNGPPDAVIINLEILLSSPRKHCQIALGSLSIGIKLTELDSAREVNCSPAIMIVSLFAMAIFFPFLTASKVGTKATFPDVATTTVSTPSWIAISERDITFLAISPLVFNSLW